MQLLAVLSLAAMALLGPGCRDAPADTRSPAPVPAALEVPAGQRLLSTAPAKGVQIYRCADGGAGGFAWKLVAPEAELLDAGGKAIGKHYAGPTWESADGSKVVGELAAKVDAPAPGAIPWLRLVARSTTAGAFAGVKSIQRIDTRGGAAPPSGCDAQHAGAEVRVEYQATYRFFGD